MRLPGRVAQRGRPRTIDVVQGDTLIVDALRHLCADIA
jgi:hypothetical protein